MQTKICSKCKIEKDICEFRKSSKSKSGLQSECKSCAKIRYLSNYEEELKKKRLYYQKNKDKIKEKNKEKIVCECGSSVNKCGLAEHYRSTKHKNYINNNILNT